MNNKNAKQVEQGRPSRAPFGQVTHFRQNYYERRAEDRAALPRACPKNLVSRSLSKTLSETLSKNAQFRQSLRRGCRQRSENVILGQALPSRPKLQRYALIWTCCVATAWLIFSSMLAQAGLPQPMCIYYGQALD